MKRNLLYLLVAAVAGCAPAPRTTPPTDRTPLYVEVGDAWDRMIVTLQAAGATPAAKGWWTLDELEDAGKGLPKYPTRDVWVLSSGELVKLWGDDPHTSRGSPQLVTRIQLLKSGVQLGEHRLARADDVEHVQRVAVGPPADAR